MKRRILVVEDNLVNRELLCDWLDAEGFEVLSAENLEQAFSFFEMQSPAAVLLDVQLGPEDGLDFASWVRRESTAQHTPIIAVTAHAMMAEQERVFQAGCNAWVAKPVEFKVLRAELHKWLQN